MSMISFSNRLMKKLISFSNTKCHFVMVLTKLKKRNIFFDRRLKRERERERESMVHVKCKRFNYQNPTNPCDQYMTHKTSKITESKI